MRTNTNTIAAIATAMSNSGIGIVRISGEEAFQIIDKIYRPKCGTKKLSEAPSHTVHYGYICDGDKVIDEVMVLILKSPNTYTREDTVEIDCHGGSLVMRRILETVIKYGARPAEPGEFTKRAFLNGRIDLCDLIEEDLETSVWEVCITATSEEHRLINQTLQDFAAHPLEYDLSEMCQEESMLEMAEVCERMRKELYG